MNLVEGVETFRVLHRYFFVVLVVLLISIEGRVDHTLQGRLAPLSRLLGHKFLKVSLALCLRSRQ